VGFFVLQKSPYLDGKKLEVAILRHLGATLDEASKTILLDESHKLDPWCLDEGPRPRSGKSRKNLHGTIFEGKSIDSDTKQRAQKESS
jgi:hypothetical protein